MNLLQEAAEAARKATAPWRREFDLPSDLEHGSITALNNLAIILNPKHPDAEIAKLSQEALALLRRVFSEYYQGNVALSPSALRAIEA
jgi:hypothetical protein